MGQERYVRYECDVCGVELVIRQGTNISSYKPPEDPDELRQWVAFHNWMHTHQSWHNEAGEASAYYRTTCPDCTWKTIEGWPHAPYLPIDMDDF